MTVSYRQTDTQPTDPDLAVCSGASLIATPKDCQCTIGGTAGSTSNTFSIAASSTKAAIMMESDSSHPNSTSWPSGNWVCRINVTTGNASLQINAVYVCRIRASVSQATVGSNTGLTVDLTNAGVYSQTVSGASQSAQTGDQWYVVWVFKNLATGARQLTIKFDQLIDTPFTTGGLFRPSPLSGLGGGGAPLTDPLACRRISLPSPWQSARLARERRAA